MDKKIKIAAIIAASLASTPAFSADKKIKSFSDIELGIETINYSEKLQNLAGYGQLQQDINVYNITTRNSAYVAINDEFGLYLDGFASLAPSVQTETWSLGEFGDIQQNDFKINHNELAFRLSYKWTEQHRIISGFRLSSLSFIRSHFEFEQPGANEFNAQLEADGMEPFVLPNGDISDRYKSNVAISEIQDEFIALFGYRYEPNELPNQGDWTWYAGIEAGIPIYSITQNTTIQGETLNEFFGGYSLIGKLGLRYQLFDNLGLLATFTSYYKYRDVVTEDKGNGNSVSVPEVNFYNNAVTLGLRWSY